MAEEHQKKRMEWQNKRVKACQACVEKEARLAELTETLQRLQAEFENHIKRAETERCQRTELSNAAILAKMLPFMDSLDSAVKNAGSDGAKGGIGALRQQFLEALQKEGMKEIEADGKLDPDVHEVMMRESLAARGDNDIIEVLQKGYMLNGRVLRCAKVKVNCKTAGGK